VPKPAAKPSLSSLAAASATILPPDMPEHPLGEIGPQIGLWAHAVHDQGRVRPQPAYLTTGPRRTRRLCRTGLMGPAVIGEFPVTAIATVTAQLPRTADAPHGGIQGLIIIARMCQHRDRSTHCHREELHTPLSESRQFEVGSFRLDGVVPGAPLAGGSRRCSRRRSSPGLPLWRTRMSGLLPVAMRVGRRKCGEFVPHAYTGRQSNNHPTSPCASSRAIEYERSPAQDKRSRGSATALFVNS
jgi:hypothetical protein